MADIGQLSDDELREQLIEYGVNVGPVTSSTRLFYEKKLGKLIDAEGNTSQQPDTEESEEEDEEEEEEDEEVQINYRQTRSAAPEVQPKPQTPYTPVVQPKPQTPYTPIVQPKPQTPYTPVVQPRKASPTRLTQRNVPARSQTAPPTSTTTPKSKSGGISMWLKLLFIIIVAFLVYLVIINMSPSAENKIPQSLD